MKVRKTTCGLCKPHKKWKQNPTKKERYLDKAMQENDLTFNLAKAVEKRQ